MDSLIGISLRGKTYYFHNTFSYEQLRALKQFANNYPKMSPHIIEQEDDAIIKQFILTANELFNFQLHILNIDEILVIR